MLRARLVESVPVADATLEPLDQIELPKRVVPVEHLAVQPGHQLQQLAHPPGSRQRRQPDVVLPRGQPFRARDREGAVAPLDLHVIGVETRAPLGESERGLDSANSTGLPNTGALGADVATLMVFKRRVNRGRLGTLIAGQLDSRVVARQRNSVHVRLGVKCAQVQVLSVRLVGTDARYPPQALGLTAGQLRLDARHYRSDFLSRSGYFTASMRDLSRSITESGRSPVLFTGLVAASGRWPSRLGQLGRTTSRPRRRNGWSGRSASERFHDERGRFWAVR